MAYRLCFACLSSLLRLHSDCFSFVLALLSLDPARTFTKLSGQTGTEAERFCLNAILNLLMQYINDLFAVVVALGFATYFTKLSVKRWRILIHWEDLPTLIF